MRFLAWCLGAILALLLGAQAVAHSAPSGWPYPGGCCAGIHCSPIPAELVKHTEDGYLIIPTGEVIPYSLANSSPDGRFHYCSTRDRHPPSEDSNEWKLLKPSDRLHALEWGEDHPSLNRAPTCFWAPDGGV